VFVDTNWYYTFVDVFTEVCCPFFTVLFCSRGDDSVTIDTTRDSGCCEEGITKKYCDNTTSISLSYIPKHFLTFCIKHEIHYILTRCLIRGRDCVNEVLFIKNLFVVSECGLELEWFLICKENFDIDGAGECERFAIQALH